MGRKLGSVLIAIMRKSLSNPYKKLAFYSATNHNSKKRVLTQLREAWGQDSLFFCCSSSMVRAYTHKENVIHDCFINNTDTYPLDGYHWQNLGFFVCLKNFLFIVSYYKPLPIIFLHFPPHSTLPS